MELIIGPRLYSTWSLRPWLVLMRCKAEFTVREIDIYSPGGQAELAGLAIGHTGAQRGCLRRGATAARAHVVGRAQLGATAQQVVLDARGGREGQGPPEGGKL